MTDWERKALLRLDTVVSMYFHIEHLGLRPRITRQEADVIRVAAEGVHMAVMAATVLDDYAKLVRDEKKRARDQNEKAQWAAEKILAICKNPGERHLRKKIMAILLPEESKDE